MFTQKDHFKVAEADLILYGVDTTYPDDWNNRQVDRSEQNFNEVQKVKHLLYILYT